MKSVIGDSLGPVGQDGPCWVIQQDLFAEQRSMGSSVASVRPTEKDG